MKINWDKKYLYWGITALLVLSGAILFYYLIFHGQILGEKCMQLINIMTPVIDGVILAYLLWPIVRFFERKYLYPLKCRLMRRFPKLAEKEKSMDRLCRGISIIFTLIIMIAALFGLFSIVIPQVIDSIKSIAMQFPDYMNNLQQWLDKLFEMNPQLEKTVNDLFNEYYQDMINWMESSLLPKLNTLLVSVSTSMFSVLGAVWDLFIGLIISVYLLGSKEVFISQGKKILYAFWEKERANALLDDARMINKTFGGFISGKLLDSLIIGIICFVCVTILKFPYPMLISVIVGVTNIIPFFGPFIGAIPCTILIFMVSPLQSVYFVLFIFILQQFDGNYLGPKILGESTGLSGFWVIFSITLFSGLMGVLGMIVGVPTFAVFYTLVKRKVDNNLDKKDLPTESVKYRHLEHIHMTSGEMIYADEEAKFREKTQNSAFRKLFAGKNKNKNNEM